MRKEKRVNVLNFLLFVIFLLLVAALVYWAAASAVQVSGKRIEPKDFSQLDTASALLKLAENVDIVALTENFGYASISSDRLYSGELCLVNDEHPYIGNLELTGIYNSLFDEDGLQIASAQSSDIEGQQEAFAALNEMLCAFYTQTELRTIMVKSAYDEYQQLYTPGYYDEYGNYVPAQLLADPKSCERMSGYSLELGLYLREGGDFADFDGEGEYDWFAKNCYRYGFILRYPEGKEQLTGVEYDAAFFRYVGRAAAYIMYQNDLCLEEFLDYVRNFGYDSPLTVQTEEGFKALYYIGDSGLATTDVQIPSDGEGNLCEYTVSGNNLDGYIITLSPTEQFAESVDAVTELDSSSEIN